MADFEPLTFATSVIGSLVVSYIGVRYFTGSKIRAERADIARRDMRAAVAPLLRSARSRTSRRGSRPSRDAETHQMEDGIAALTVLRIARDLPLWRRLLVRRRCRIIFGDQWSDIAEQQVDVSTDPKVDADHLFANALFWDLHHEGDPAIGRNRIGLVQRAYSSNSEDNAARLATHLSRLSKSR